MTGTSTSRFDLSGFFAKAGLGRQVVQLNPKETFFSQGSSADSIFYLQKGRAKLTVVSNSGKEATLALLSAGDFIGEESLAGAGGGAHGDCFRVDGVHGTQNRKDGDGPCDAQGNFSL